MGIHKKKSITDGLIGLVCLREEANMIRAEWVKYRMGRNKVMRGDIGDRGKEEGRECILL